MTLEIYAKATNEADRAAAEAIGACSTLAASSSRTSPTWRGWTRDGCEPWDLAGSARDEEDRASHTEEAAGS
ncbi:MAG: hypothetical protein ABIX10_04755 [Acidimicrobiales bacterium]